jgi:DNA-binding LacI/PurR family transcriptional regulator
MVTIRDISKKCGVSPATVSKALNGYTDVGAETAKKIRETAREMHYMPNAAARLLKTKASHNIGVVFEDETQSGLAHEFFSQILNSAKNEMERSGYDITFISSMIGGNSFLEHCRYRKCDGVLVASVDFTSRQVTELAAGEFPVVTIDYSFPGQSSVISDNVEGAYELVKYLILKGHRRIAFIHGEDTLVTQKRIEGFYRGCAEYGIRVPDEYVRNGAYHDPERTRTITTELMKLPTPPTAILFPDDYSYIGGRIALERMGLSIPNDVSAVGYDGIGLSQVLRPRLTTWFQDAEGIGRKAGRKLIEMIEHRDTAKPEIIKVKGHFLEGDSVRSAAEPR